MENIYEPAALIAVRCKAYAVAREIRELPNPPSELPMFTAQELAAEMRKYDPNNPDGPFRSEIVANYINARLAAFRAATDDGGAIERDIQSRIRAAVLAERQACAEAVTHMRVPPEKASQSTLLQIAIGILKREENTDDAGDGETCGSSPSLTASLPVAEDGAGREQSPLTYGQVRQQIEAEHSDDPNHYGVAATARRLAELQAFGPWIRLAEALADAVCSSASVPLHCKHEVEAALNALPVVRKGETT